MVQAGEKVEPGTHSARAPGELRECELPVLRPGEGRSRVLMEETPPRTWVAKRGSDPNTATEWQTATGSCRPKSQSPPHRSHHLSTPWTTKGKEP